MGSGGLWSGKDWFGRCGKACWGMARSGNDRFGLVWQVRQGLARSDEAWMVRYGEVWQVRLGG